MEENQIDNECPPVVSKIDPEPETAEEFDLDAEIAEIEHEAVISQDAIQKATDEAIMLGGLEKNTANYKRLIKGYRDAMGLVRLYISIKKEWRNEIKANRKHRQPKVVVEPQNTENILG